MQAAEYFNAVSEATRDAQQCKEVLQMLKSREGLHGVRYDRVPMPCGLTNKMDATITRIDYENSLPARIKADADVIADAIIVLYGKDGKGGLTKAMGRKYADVLYLRYMKQLSWRALGREAGWSDGYCRLMHKKALDYIETNGLARIREL